ncbi:hypothetical protein GRH00_005012 [Salmonella enterica subsp. salamae]|nr:hypothetical protein [Salmonella enterica subsp. salamae]
MIIDTSIKTPSDNVHDTAGNRIKNKKRNGKYTPEYIELKTLAGPTSMVGFITRSTIKKKHKETEKSASKKFFIHDILFILK